MYRKYKEEKEGGEEKKKKKDKDPNRPRYRWDLDYQLEPFEGLSPEYMEMSEWIWIDFELQLACCHQLSSLNATLIIFN